jgi:hypothetical protein
MSVTSTHWGGTLPAEGYERAYGDIASSTITNLNGCFYTNHAFAGLFYSATPIQINGALISRNESIVYSAPGLVFNHDERLTGGTWGDLGLIGGGGNVWDDVEIISWWRDDNICYEQNACGGDGENVDGGECDS